VNKAKDNACFISRNLRLPNYLTCSHIVKKFVTDM
jgi:hypothetical protein